jgi:hypothetical protein
MKPRQSGLTPIKEPSGQKIDGSQSGIIGLFNLIGFLGFL